MSRFDERKEDYNNAVERLKEAFEYEESELMIDGILHRFEFTFELAWKVVKDYLEYMGINGTSGSPREVIQLGFKQGIIENAEEWLEMMISRNQLSHIYDESNSRIIYEKIRNKYLNLLIDLKNKI